MSKITPIFRGKILAGKISFETSERERMELWAESQSDGDYRFYFKKDRNNRSESQNNYYWAVVVELLADSFGWTPEDMHEYLKGQFNVKNVVHEGKEYRIARSTASLNTSEFVDYIDRCVRFAGEQGVVVPEPNEINLGND